MAEFINVMKEYNRMCEYYKLDCRECPLCNVNCEYVLHNEAEKSESIIMKWAREHPIPVYPRVRDILNTMAINMGYPVNDFNKYFLDSQINEKCAKYFGIKPINEDKLTNI